MNDEEMRVLLEVVQRPERPRATPEERLQALEDRSAIRALIMAYGYLCDARRWDDLLALYTDDIERVLAGSLTERVRGKAALRQLGTQRADRRIEQGGRTRRAERIEIAQAGLESCQHGREAGIVQHGERSHVCDTRRYGFS